MGVHIITSGMSVEGVAEIAEHVEFNQFTGQYHRVSIEWIGDPSWPVRLHYSEDASTFPWTMECIRDDRYAGIRTWIRTDAGLWYAYHRILADWCKFLYWCHKIRALMILTAVVWGLADMPPGGLEYRAIDWRYLKIFRGRNR